MTWLAIGWLTACEGGGGAGEPPDEDPCAAAPGDADGDGICDALDACPGGDDAADADGDGVCDLLDACEGADDGWDQDGNGVPDACDVVLVATALGPKFSVSADPPFRVSWSYDAEGVELGWTEIWEKEGASSVTWAADDEAAAPFVALLTDGVEQTITLYLLDLVGGAYGWVSYTEPQWNLDDAELGLPDLADFVVDHLVETVDISPSSGGARTVQATLEVWGHRDPDPD